MFHEIAIGDITWAAKLSCRSEVIGLRRNFRWMLVGIAGGFVVIVVQMALTR